MKTRPKDPSWFAILAGRLRWVTWSIENMAVELRPDERYSLSTTGETCELSKLSEGLVSDANLDESPPPPVQNVFVRILTSPDSERVGEVFSVSPDDLSPLV